MIIPHRRREGIDQSYLPGDAMYAPSSNTRICLTHTSLNDISIAVADCTARIRVITLIWSEPS